MHFPTLAVLLSATSLVAAAPSNPRQSHVSVVRVGENCKYSGYYVAYGTDGATITKDKNRAQKFDTIKYENKEILQTVHINGVQLVYLDTTDAPQGFGSVQFDGQRNTKVIVEGGELKDTETNFGHFMICGSDKGPVVHYAKVGFQLDTYNKEAGSQNACEYAPLSVVSA